MDYPIEIPELISNWVEGTACSSVTEKHIEKINPANGKKLFNITRSNFKDVKKAISIARKVQPLWASIPPVKRGMILLQLVQSMQQNLEQIADLVVLETGKSYNDAIGEVNASIELGLFYASEGQRLYGKTTTSGVPNRSSMIIRQPVGIAGLIVAANTPIANIAWKLFPALICGNTVILKASENTPASAWFMGRLINDTDLPKGTVNIIQGLGKEAGEPIVEHPDIGVISFTGSTQVGKRIQQITSDRFVKVSLELGGKNAFVVCDDADLENAVKWGLLSAFSNAGQRCVSASRIIVMQNVYEKFKEMLLRATLRLKVGPTNNDDLGPVINETQLTNMLYEVEKAEKNGAKILCGGSRINSSEYSDGYYLNPTILEGVSSKDDLSKKELFGPITCLYKAETFDHAIKLVNDSPYGLSACIHTRNINRSVLFTQKVETGVAVVNGGTHGSEPHMPFGGVKNSGNGTREPGTEAIDIYSYLKDIYIHIDPNPEAVEFN